MGKKTEKWIKQLNSLVDDCDNLYQKLTGIVGALAIVREESADLARAHSKRVNEIDPNGTTQHEDEISNDPEIQRINNELDSVNKDFSNLLREKSKTKQSLGAKANEFKGVLIEFNTYIVKKEKSKNPFRGKKSVPAAKEYIATGTELLNQYLQAAN